MFQSRSSLAALLDRLAYSAAVSPPTSFRWPCRLAADLM